MQSCYGWINRPGVQLPSVDTGWWVIVSTAINGNEIIPFPLHTISKITGFAHKEKRVKYRY